MKAHLTEQEILQAVREFTGRQMGDGWEGTRAFLYVDRETSEVTATCEAVKPSLPRLTSYEAVGYLRAKAFQTPEIGQ